MTAHRRMIQLPVDDIAMGDSGTVCRHRGVGPRARFAACLAAICLGSLLAAPAALAEFHVTSIDGSVSGPNGEPFTQAGGHPYAITTTVSFDVGSPQESAKDIHVHVPAGLIGNPRAVATCTESQLANATEGASPADCPGDSQVGLVTFETTLGPIGPGPLFNMQAPAGEPAQFGIKAFETSHLDASVRTGGDYGIDIDSDRTSQGLPLTGVTVELWGVPSDPSHDAQRYCGETNTPGCAATGVPRPLLTLPTSCQGPLTTSSKRTPGSTPETGARRASSRTTTKATRSGSRAARGPTSARRSRSPRTRPSRTRRAVSRSGCTCRRTKAPKGSPRPT